MNSPYANVKRPVKGESVEIGQPTFVELISARAISTRAIGKPSPNVSAALRTLAFGKSSVAHEIQTTEQGLNGIANKAITKYTLGQEAKAYKDKVKGVTAARESIQFMEFIRNNDLSLYTTNCQTIDPLQGQGCPETDCHLDVVWSIDNSGSMDSAIQAVKEGIDGLINLVNSVSDGSYRLGLQMFGQSANNGNLTTLVPLTNQPCENVAGFKAGLGNMGIIGGREPWHQAVQSVVGFPQTGRTSQPASNEWQFRADADVRMLIIVTDEVGFEVELRAAADAADEMGRCGIRFVMVWTSSTHPALMNTAIQDWPTLADFLDDMAQRTDGYWVHSNRGVDMLPLMTSFMLSTCLESQPPKCPGGQDKILNGIFETSIASWVNISTLPDRDVKWSSQWQAMELTGAANQVVTGLEPGDLVVLNFEAALEGSTVSSQTISAYSETGEPYWLSACLKGFSLLNFDNFFKDQNILGWTGQGTIGSRGLSLTTSDQVDVSKTYTNLTPGEPFSFAVNIDAISSGSFYIQLTDGTNILAEKQYNQGIIRPLAVQEFNKQGCECGITPHILNGTITYDRPEIGQVGAVTSFGEQFFCTGALISGRHVLTAAHCLFDSNGTMMPNTAGRFKVTINSTTPPISFSSKRVFVHQHYNPNALGTNNSNDIAIIELEDDVADLLGITPIPICSDNFDGGGTDPLVGDMLEIWGYGRGGTGTEHDGVFGTKRVGNVQIDEITSRLIKWIFDTEAESSTTFGDSGGPQLVFRGGTGYIASITSGGTSSGFITSTTFNMRVSAYDLWIKEIISGPTVITQVPSTGQITATMRLVANSSSTIDILDCAACVEDQTLSGLLKYSLRDSNSNLIADGQAADTDLNAVDNYKSFELTGYVGLDGSIEVRFDAEAGNKVTFYIDNVLLCVMKEDDCGPGTRNGVLNPNFLTGIEYWNDKNNNQIVPIDDPAVWDSLINAIIISVSARGEVRTEVDSLRPGATYILNFEIASFEPEINGLEFSYGVYDDAGNVLVQVDTTRSLGEPFPKRLNLDFQAPPSSKVIVFFRPGLTSGVVKIRNVLVCTSFGECEVGYNKISFDDFETGSGAWTGGIYDPIGKLMRIPAEGTLQQTFHDLIPGAAFQLTFNSLTAPDGVGRYLVEFHSNGLIDQHTTDSAPGIKTYEMIVQATGMVTITIKNLMSYEARLDDILICQQDEQLCDGSISDLEVQIEWVGVPRKPVNLLNTIIRYTVRDPNDPHNINTITHIPITESASGIQGCSRWKQQAPLGNISNEILKIGLLPATVDNIQAGMYVQSATRLDYIWAIPDIGSIPDVLTVSFPSPPEGLIESVEVLLLTNQVIVATEPVLPPPLGCTPDPGLELGVSIKYRSSTGFQKRFTKYVNVDGLWLQPDLSTHMPPWDTPLETGNGRRGVVTRWESFQFLLDTTDGQGLDQCTGAIAFSTVGKGVFRLPEFDFVRGGGAFAPECDAEVIISSISGGTAVNEVQSIVLPNPTGGTWDLSFTYAGRTETATLQWNAGVVELALALASLSNVGAGNTPARGSGTNTDPFLITFTRTLGGADLPLFEADGSNLTGSIAFITTITNGTLNERQIIIPEIDATQDLVITFDGETTTPIPYNASLDIKQATLESLSNIGGGNIRVSGDISDKTSDYVGRIVVDFVNDLGNEAVPEMVASTGYSVVVDWEGGIGIDEQQRVTVQATSGTFRLRLYDDSFCDCEISIINSGGGNAGEHIRQIKIDDPAERGSWRLAIDWLDSTDGVLTVESGTTRPLHWDATLDDVKEALEDIGLTIENVIGTPSADYTITFNLAIELTSFTITHDLQYVCLGNFVDTPKILYDADAATLKSIIVNATSWLTADDIIVTKEESQPDFHQWVVQWTGKYAKTDIRQMTIDRTELKGGQIIVTEVTKGSGVSDKQRVQIWRASGGSFKLGVDMDGHLIWTDPIPWNTTAIGLQAQLSQLPFFGFGDIMVDDDGSTGNVEVNASFTITFDDRFGSIPLMKTDFLETLLCNPLLLSPVAEGPHDYIIPHCDDPNDLSCQSGPLLCKPGEGDDELPPEDPCCTHETITAEANVSERLQIERDLFDPNRRNSRGAYLTLQDLALTKGLQVSDYVPYERDWRTGKLKLISWSTIAETKRSFVLIEADLDAKNGRNRVKAHLDTHRHILPTRFVWSGITS